MAEQLPPNWQDYLTQMQQMVGLRDDISPMPAGTPTMDYINMESANRRHAQALAAEQAMHAQSLALEQQKLALSNWEAQQRWTLAYMEYEAKKAADAAAAAANAGATSNIDLAKELALYQGTASGEYAPIRRNLPIWDELF